MIGRSSTRLLAPPGGVSSLGWVFGGGGSEPSVQARREGGSARGSGRPRIIAGKIVHGDDSNGQPPPQQERQPERAYGRARATQREQGGGWGGPAAAAREEAERAERERQQQAHERQQQQERQQQEAQERQRWEQQVREQHQGASHRAPVRHQHDAELHDISQKMAAAELLSERAMHTQQESLGGAASGHATAKHTPSNQIEVEPSAQYKFARNPAQTIRRAILSQLEQRAMQPRLQWRALCECAGVSRDPTFTRTNALTPAQFCGALKAFGTGILLEPEDVKFVFGGPDSISFARFCEWCG